MHPSYLSFLSIVTVITGFNTDIEHEGVIYHVQTEDKGLARPIILSLVYDRGTILASKRSPYDDLLAGEFDEEQLAARLQRQHRLICAAIQAGRIDDLRKMTAKDGGKESGPASSPVKKPESTSPAAASAPAPAPVAARSPLPEFDTPIPKPVFVKLPPLPSPRTDPTIDVLDATEVFDDYLVTEDAISLVNVDVAADDGVGDQLKIEIAQDLRYRGGDRRTIEMRVSNSRTGSAISNAQVMVKILGSNFRPLIFHSSTDAYGLAAVDVQFPNFNTGRAAILIRAISEGYEAEFRRAIDHS